MSQHQLAAIMFTDIVGYTRIMGENEQQALKMLRKNRHLHKSLIKKYQGRWLKEMGDGTLASFKSITDAVLCAGAIVKAIGNEGYALRVGIHQGEITEETGDIFGDGVNIASRIEPLAQPGQILVTYPVYQNAKNKPGITIRYLKEAQLKNVDEPVGIYELTVEVPDQVPVLNNKVNLKPVWAIASIILVLAVVFVATKLSSFEDQAVDDLAELEKSIAVLPFKSLSSDVDDQYFADGVAEAVINQLSSIGDLRVSSRTSTTPYRDSEKSIQQIGEELEVTYILEASVQKIANQVRITTNIVNVANNKNIWSEQYTEPMEDVFAIMNNVAKSVTSELQVNLSPAEGQYMLTNPSTDFNAYDLYMRGRSLFGTYSTYYEAKDLFAAEAFYRNAIEIDSTFALSYVGLGEIADQKRARWNVLSVEAAPQTDSILYYASEAIRLDPKLAAAYALRGKYYRYTDQPDKAIEDLQSAVTLNSNLTESYMTLGEIWQDERNDPVTAYRYLKTAMYYEKNGSLKPNILHELGLLVLTLGDFNRAREFFKLSSTLRPGTKFTNGPIVWSYIVEGKFEQGFQFLDPLCASETADTWCKQWYWFLYVWTEDFERALVLEEKTAKKQTIPDAPVPSQKDENRPPGDHLEAAILMNTGREDQGRAMLENVIRYEESRGDKNLWEQYGHLGDYDKCMEELLKLEDSDPFSMVFEMIQHYFPIRPLYENPEFKNMITRYDQRTAEARAQIRQIDNSAVAGANAPLIQKN